MGKGSKRQRKAAAKTHLKADALRRNDLDVDDDIDAFYRQRDVIPLDVDDKSDESDDDLVEPVFNIEGSEDDDSDNAKSDDEEDKEYSGVHDNIKDKGFAAKIARQAKYLRQKFGTDDDDMDDNEEEQEEEKKAIWGRRKDLYYSADNVDYELQSSDEDLPMEEEAEVVKIQREKAKTLLMEDFGLQNVDQDKSDLDEHKKFQDAFAGKTKSGIDADNTFQNYEEIKKDLTDLSKEEQMEVVYSSAPELVGLLSELNEALDQVGEVKPVLLKKAGERTDRGRGMHFLEIKDALLLSYCQAISYYLLLKSEGHPVRDHPVIARLVEIKNLLEKVKEIDTKGLPQEVEKNANETTIANSENVLARGVVPFEVKTDTTSHLLQPNEDVEKTDFAEDAHKMSDNHNTKEDVQVGIQSLEMLKIRANLEAKLKEKGIYNQTKSKCERVKIGAQKAVDGHLKTLDYFDDEVQLTASGHSKNIQSSSQTPKLPPLIKSKTKKSKVVSGDDDLPKRDDIGERRRRHELQVLARTGAVDDSDVMQDEDGDLGTRPMDNNDLQESDGKEESEDEFYREVKKQKIEKLMAKAAKYTRTPAVPSSEPETDGKRHITYQMEKNRGLTRQRKKLNKNPRKKYRHKHEKQVKRRKGQVRDIRKPSGPYGGEATGINIRASHSIKFKN